MIPLWIFEKNRFSIHMNYCSDANFAQYQTMARRVFILTIQTLNCMYSIRTKILRIVQFYF